MKKADKNILNNKYLHIVGIIIIIVLLIALSRGNGTKENGDLYTDIPTDTTEETGDTSPPSSTRGDNTQVQTTSVSDTDGETTNFIEPPVEEPVPEIPTAEELDGSTFRMTSYNGKAVSEDSKYTINFEDWTLNAKFCNSLSSQFLLDGNSIKAQNLVGTKSFCAFPENLMEIEQSFISILNTGAQIYKTGDTIVLSHPAGTVMTFTGF